MPLRAMSSHLLLLLLCLATGCIYVPTPHKEWITPPASGRVLVADAHTPLFGAVVTRYQPAAVPFKTRTDSDGRFLIPGVRELRWFHLDRPAYGRFRVEASGYAPVDLSRAGWAFNRDLHFDFGEVLLSPRRNPAGKPFASVNGGGPSS
jgi:hypothetical protein